MSKRAEEAAMKAYPVHIIEHQKVMGGVIKIDTNTNPRFFFTEGYELAEKDLGWHSVDISLPEIDEEVIVLTDEEGIMLIDDEGAAPIYKIGLGHIVDRRYAMDFNGWNIPGVKYWMPMPKIPNEE